MRHFIALAQVVVIVASGGPSLSGEAEGDEPVDPYRKPLTGHTDSSGVGVGSDADGGLFAPGGGEDAQPVSGSSEPAPYRYQRHPSCQEWVVWADGTTPVAGSWPDEIPACEAEIVSDVTCPDGSEPTDPWWRSALQADGSYGPWVQVSGYACAVDPLPAAIAAAWERMPIAASAVSFRPHTGWAIAKWGIAPAITEEPQMQDVTVLGVEVILRATPTAYTWSSSDGTELRLEGTGQGDAETTLLFTAHEHRATVQVTTTWEGHYSLDGGSTWLVAPGQASTTSEAASVHVFNPRARLVDCDTAGRCRSGDSASMVPFTLTDPDADGIDNHTIPDDKIDAYLERREDNRRWNDSERIDPSGHDDAR